MATAGAAAAALWPSTAFSSPIVQYSWPGRPGYKTLEIVQVGGLSHTETTWMHHANKLSVWHDVRNADWSRTGLTADPYLPAGWTHFPTSPDISMSPAATPLQGSALWSRLRAVAVAHRLAPHDPARVLSTTGKTIGRPDKAGLGAMVQANENEHVPSGTPRPSFVLDAGSVISSAYAAYFGLLGTSTRPIVLPVGNAAAAFVTRLDRTAFLAGDTLTEEYASRYASRLDFPQAAAARSLGHDAYAAAVGRLDGAVALGQVLQGGPSLVPSGAGVLGSPTFQAIRVAAWLLKHDHAQHVCVIDPGAIGPYDMHSAASLNDHASVHNVNMWTVFRALRQALDDGDLDLAGTLVHLHTDFGRVWAAAPSATTNLGSDHWWRGYANLLIGGPIPATGPSIRGALEFTGAGDPTGGLATDGPAANVAYNPTDVRAATALAAGIDPFASGLLRRDDVSTRPTTDGAALNLALGLLA